MLVLDGLVGLHRTIQLQLLQHSWSDYCDTEWFALETNRDRSVIFEIARRDKKAFLSDQCKELEENNRMGKTRDLLKKIRDTKGTLHAKVGTIKDRNGMDLTEAEDTKKRWQEHRRIIQKRSS